MAVLWEMGTRGVEVRPAAGTDVELLAFFEQASDPLPALAAALASLQPASLEPAVVPEVDWVARFREGFRGFAVGRFDIVPAWQAAVPQPGRIPLVVDPGQAFGTGTHETTRMCLRLIERLFGSASPPKRVLDFGTGTGILGIAAARLGAEDTLGTDIDPKAVETAGENARINGVADRFRAENIPLLSIRERFDLIVANILAEILVDLKREIAALSTPDGRLLLSGILSEKGDWVLREYATERFFPEERIEDGQWTALLLRRAAGSG